MYFSDGESHAQLVNVVARRVDNGGTPANESRTTAASGVSGNEVRIFNGNPINEPSDMPVGPFRSQEAADIGRYEIPLPPGNYMIEVESIDPNFTEGSSVGGDDLIHDAGHRTGAARPRHRDGRPDQHGPRRDAHRHAAPLRPVRGPVRNPLQNGWRAFATSLLLAMVAACGGGGGGDNGGGGNGPPNITASTLDGGVIGTPYSETVTASGGTGTKTFSISAGALPAGLAISAGGAITGTPVGPAGDSDFTVSVSDSAATPQTDTQALSITIVDPLADHDGERA